jgi:hypothetical protein
MFAIRIFFFGMIAVVTGGHNAAVLLPYDQDHTAYLAFNAGCSGGDCGDRLFYPDDPSQGLSLLPGVLLDKNQIVLEQVTKEMSALTFTPGPAAGDQVPTSMTEAAGFGWVLSIKSLLDAGGVTPKPGHQNGEADPRCWKTPAACVVPLAAVMELEAGEIGSCSLIETDGLFDGENIDTFDAVSGSGQAVLSQAIAGVVRLRAVVTGAPSVTVVVQDWNGTKVRSFILAPKACDDALKQCVDIMVGNIAPEDLATTPEGIRTSLTAPHFANFFSLLTAAVSPDLVSVPVDSGKKRAPVAKVQSTCGDPVRAQLTTQVPLFTYFDAKLFSRLDRMYSVAPDAVYSKPLCPPAALVKPAA